MSMLRASCAVLLLFASVSLHAATTADDADRGMRALAAARPDAPRPLAPMHSTPCVDGMAGIYPCSNIDLLAFVPLAEFTASSTNSLWGWTDPVDNTEYALIGADNGTAFYRLTDPTHPVYLGKLPTHAGTGSSIWRDVRVYQNHAFVVSDNNPGHGMQVFDLEALRSVTTPQTFAETAWYGAFGSSHTISINEATGYAYVPGSNLTCPGDPRSGGLQMLDIRVPDAPVYAGCVSDAAFTHLSTTGYTHESQCWVYAGPDTAHVGKEICVDSNGPTKRVAIVDVSNKAAPVTLSSVTYAGASYPHQGWLTDDQRYLLVDDELDEQNVGHNARTYFWDVSDLDAPVLVGHHDSALGVIDHNLYVHGPFVYQSNYEAGLRILRIDNLSTAQLTEVAYFDTYPASNNPEFNGSWNNYRFPGSGNVIVTGIDEGFFVLQPDLCSMPATPNVSATPNGDNRIDLGWNASAGAKYRVERAQGGCNGAFETIADQIEAGTYADMDASGLVDYGYRIVAHDASGICAAPASSCVAAQTSGSCTAPPLFAGVATAQNAGSAQCRVDLAWPAATPACGASSSYSVYRSDLADFTPAAANRIANGIGDLAFADQSVAGGAPQYYVVRAADGANGSEDANLVRLAVTPTGADADGTFVSGAEPGDPPFEAESATHPASLAPGQIEHAGWHMSSTRMHGGAQSFWSTAANNLCVTLVTPALTLSAGQSSQLSFWSAWDVEQGWDGGVVEISTDGGTNWTRLTPAGGYPATITQGGALCGVAVGSGAFTGMNHFSWSPYQIDLAAYAGQSVKLRWLYRTDTAQTGEGWFVDDIALTHTQVPGTCAIGSDVIFANGFDGTTH